MTRSRTCRQRCWRYDWALDLDLKSFFDSLDHSLVLKAVAHHTNLRWILLYVERWLKAPLQLEDGTLRQRDRGSPQGSAISPVLANLFLHYALDMWLVREFPAVPFERYADDGILHCKTQGANAGVARRDHRTVGAGRSGTESGQDAHRVLQGLEPHRLSRARAVGSSRGAVPALPPVRFPDPPAEPDVPVPEHPALRRTCGGRSWRWFMQRRSPAGWWPGLFRWPPTARGCDGRDSGIGSPAPRRARRASRLRGRST